MGGLCRGVYMTADGDAVAVLVPSSSFRVETMIETLYDMIGGPVL